MGLRQLVHPLDNPVAAVIASQPVETAREGPAHTARDAVVVAGGAK
jgi:hypothetical protein